MKTSSDHKRSSSYIEALVKDTALSSVYLEAAVVVR